jgi:hypothetical protein
MRIARAVVAGTLLACCGCATAEPSAVAPVGAAVPIACTETAATPGGERPPVLASTTGSWYGSADLWVGLADHPPTKQGDRLVLKFPWVTLQDGKPTAALGPPQVAATRTGVVTPVAAGFGQHTRSFGTGGLSFWPAALEFPEGGCWTVTGRFGDTTVEFVVQVDEP